MALKIKRAEKYGFCAGVRLADRKVKKFARLGGGGRGQILGQVVHNERVVGEMLALGVPTVDALEEAPVGSTIVFSAHGVPPSFHQVARERGLSILDTTCPFVYDIHDEARDALDEGYHLVFVGEPRHREVIGYTHDLEPGRFHVLTSVEEAAAIDWARFPKVKVLYQTTLNAADFEDLVRFIEARVAEAGGEARRADTICYATKENQDAARALAADPEVDVILVVGGRRSANTRHLWELCTRNKPSHWIQGPGDLDPAWFETARGVGITAGASTPDYVIDEVEAALQRVSTAA